MILNEKKWAKGWSDSLVADFRCYPEWRATAAYHKGLTGGMLSQRAVQHSYKFCLCSFSLHLLAWLRIQILFSVKSWWICIPMAIHCKLVTPRSALGTGFGLVQVKEGWGRGEVGLSLGSQRGQAAFTVGRGTYWAVVSLWRRLGKMVLIPASIALRPKICVTKLQRN